MLNEGESQELSYLRVEKERLSQGIRLHMNAATKKNAEEEVDLTKPIFEDSEEVNLLGV